MIVAVPNRFAAGVKVNVPLVAIAGADENKSGLVFPVTVNVTTWPVEPSRGPGEIGSTQAARVFGPESSRTDGGVPRVNSGSSFTGATTIEIVSVSV